MRAMLFGVMGMLLAGSVVAKDIRFVFMDQRWLATVDETTLTTEADGSRRGQVALYAHTPYQANKAEAGAEPVLIDYTLSDVRADCTVPGRTLTLTRLAFRSGFTQPLRLQDATDAAWVTSTGTSVNYAWWLGLCQNQGTVQAVPAHSHEAMLAHYRSPGTD